MPPKITKKVKESITICGTTVDKIRKAYFENKLTELLDGIQAQAQHSESEINKLADYLNGLKKESSKVFSIVKEKIGEFDLDTQGKPPTVEELMQGASDEEWREKANSAEKFITDTLDKVRDNIRTKTPFEYNYWFNISVVFLSLEDIITRDVLYKEQLYRARLTNIIDKNNISRKEAEERASMTNEFFEYKRVKRLIERLEEFYTFARRGDDKQNNK